MGRTSRGARSWTFAIPSAAILLVAWQARAQGAGCCFADGTCTGAFGNACLHAGGTPVQSCTPDACLGACCSDNQCTLTIADACQLPVYYGSGTTCGLCLSACCLSDGSCAELTPSICSLQGGVLQGLETYCADTTCVGACCLADAACEEMGPDPCASAGGAYQGRGTACAPVPVGDFDCDGSLLTEWGLRWLDCLKGPEQATLDPACDAVDLDADGDVDLGDVARVGQVKAYQACSAPIPCCGNGVVEAGEQCDDGNTMAGDGCDAICQDACESNHCCDVAFPIGDGTTNFTNVGATVDGPVHCSLESDVWYEYTAPCSGTLTVNTFGSGFDTALAVYGGCTCGDLSSNCCRPYFGLGCDDPTCESAVCAELSYCCNVRWDGFCADAASGLCGTCAAWPEPLLTCNDDANAELESSISFPIVEGNCYKLQVGGYHGRQGSGVLHVDSDCCGNGEVDPEEECDDGNTMPGDGCDALCRSECTPGTPGCGWQEGDAVTYNQINWGDPVSTAGVLLAANYNPVYFSTGGVLEVGLTGAAGFSMAFTDAGSVLAYNPSVGPVGPLNADLLNPTSSASGAYGGEVVALKLNVDFSDANVLGPPSIDFGNLLLCGFAAQPALNGMTVRDFLAVNHAALGGGTALYPITDLFGIAAELNSAFESELVSQFAQDHLFNGACP